MQTNQIKLTSVFEVEFFTLNGSELKNIPATDDVACYNECDKMVKSNTTPYISFQIKKQL